MSKNLLSERDKELQKLAEQYEAAKAEGKPIYLDADDLADMADWFAIRHKVDQANEIVEYGLSIHVNNTSLLVQKAYLYIDEMNWEKAEEIAYQIHEESSEVIILRANLLLNAEQEEEAEKLLETLQDKDDLATIIDVVYMYVDLNYPEKATEWLARGEERYANNESYLAVTADCLYAVQDYAKAEEFYNNLIDKNPYSAPYWYGLARCHFERNAFDKAIEACDFAIISDEEFADAYVMKGHSYFHLDNEEEALASYKQAEKLNALSTAFLHAFTGLNMITKGEWEKGYKHFQRAIDERTCDFLPMTLLYANAALCLHKMGKKRKAHQYCKEAYKLDPQEIDVHLIEARIYMEEGNYKKGVKCFAIALEKAPCTYTWYEIGLCSLEIGQLLAAKKAFEQVQELDPNYEGINERLATLCIVLKDREGFEKYNPLCENPLTPADIDRIKNTAEDEEEKSIIASLESLFDPPQKN